MYKISLKNKEVNQLEVVNFSELQVKERFDIEVWVKNNPSILKENLLIISEQVLLPSGRQPDLIALDKSGNLVIIELKRDDSGRDVYWQAITYAAQFSEYAFSDVIDMYESFLKKSGIKESNAKERIEEFVEEDLENINQKQRIFIVSKEFHQDVLKASLWLSDYDVDIKVVKSTPYKFTDDMIFLDSEVIMPTPGVEDYIDKRAKKAKGISTLHSTTWWSLDKGTFNEEDLKKRLKGTFTSDSPVAPRFKKFVKILLSEERKFNREEIKVALYDMDVGNNVGHAGRLLSNISQLLTKRSTSHLRQVIDFEMPQGEQGEVKDNFCVVPEYRDLVREVLDEIEIESNE
jgi:Predicted nuclease of the RecB family